VREIELKAVVPDWNDCRARLEAHGATLEFEGRLADRRFDTADRALAREDVVLRVRAYENASGAVAELGWKGPTRYEDGYKVRDELAVDTAAPERLATILSKLGYQVTRAIDRHIVQCTLHGAVVRLERYPRMDDLIEVEGPPDAIERAIAVLGIPRQAFTSERLRDFATRYQTRTGQRAVLSDDELAGRADYSLEDA
jgi:adenylate cyclase class IV